MSIDINDIAGPDGDSVKFDTVGVAVKGTIVHAEKMVRINTYNGNSEEVIRIALEQDDGSTAIIWPVTNTNTIKDGYPTKMAKAIGAAVRTAGATSLEVGGTLAVKYSGNGVAKVGQTAPKLYEAKYAPPAAAPEPAPEPPAAIAADDPFGF